MDWWIGTSKFLVLCRNASPSGDKFSRPQICQPRSAGLGKFSTMSVLEVVWIYLFIWGLRRFQHCTGHITMGSWKGRGNQYIQFVRVLYCKLPTNGKQLPAFPLEAMPGTEPWPQRWEARVLPLCHCGPVRWCGMQSNDKNIYKSMKQKKSVAVAIITWSLRSPQCSHRAFL